MTTPPQILMKPPTPIPIRISISSPLSLNPRIITRCWKLITMQPRILFALITFVSLSLRFSKWHPDKQKDQDSATSRFQEINEAYHVLSDPVKRREYDINGMRYVYDYNIIDYLDRYKGLILTCNGLGLKHSIW
uniref:Uncharacterized protein LOC101496602 isoform X2 n=1 Tax=Cicer arietinum TaxID=3827 RepID=A0A1S2XJT4_CICAR|nr:uncharacterized protein LOC101496602 isoform X2 [Cicer arietinum]